MKVLGLSAAYNGGFSSIQAVSPDIPLISCICD